LALGASTHLKEMLVLEKQNAGSNALNSIRHTINPAPACSTLVRGFLAQQPRAVSLHFRITPEICECRRMMALEFFSAEADRYGCKEELHVHACIFEFVFGNKRFTSTNGAENTECLTGHEWAV